MENIIFKECSNEELSPQERLKLEMWLRESSENRRVYAQLKLTYLYPGASKRASIEKKVLNDIKDRLAVENKTSRQISFGQSWLKVAAIFLLFFIATTVIYLIGVRDNGVQEITSTKMIEKVSLPGQKITTMLPDGTIVQLNADSKIMVPEFFSENIREVHLVGEAFFEVVKDKSRPFVIRTNDVKVEVLGTSFNVRAYDTESVRSVAVRTGVVAVSRISNEDDIKLQPNQMVSIMENGTPEKAAIADQDLVFGWTEQRLVFVDEPLEGVLETISRWYGVNIDRKGEIETGKLYTANYKNPVLQEVVASLSHVYNFQYTITPDEKKVIIR